MPLFDYIGDQERRPAPEEEAMILAGLGTPPPRSDESGAVSYTTAEPEEPATTGSSNISGGLDTYREKREELERVRGTRPERGDKSTKPKWWRMLLGYGAAAGTGYLNPRSPERGAALGRKILDQPYTQAMEKYEADLGAAEAGVAGAREEYGLGRTVESDRQRSELFELNKQIKEKELAGMLTAAEARQQRQAIVGNLPEGALDDREAAVYVATGKIPPTRARPGVGRTITVRGPDGKPQIIQFDPDAETYSIPAGEGMPRSNENYTIQIANLNRWRGDQIRKLDLVRADPMKQMKDEDYQRLKDGIEASHRDQAQIFGGLDVSGVTSGDFPDIVGDFNVGGSSPGQTVYGPGAAFEESELDAFAPPVPPTPTLGGAGTTPAIPAGAQPGVKAQGEVLMRAPASEEFPEGELVYVDEGEVEEAERNDWVRVRDNTPAEPPKPRM